MSEEDLFLGIDPGKTGTIAVVDGFGRAVAVDDMPRIGGEVDAAAVLGIIREFAPRVRRAAIERTQAMPTTPRSVCHSLGMSEGLALAALMVLGLPVIRPRPAEWKKAMGVPADKAAAKEKAEMLFPHMKHRLARASDHNRAEALLLADFARQQFSKGK